jgi:pimeloyl-ACP methyl ester carboxylesterase
MEVTLPNGRIATYEVIGSGGEPLLTFVGGPGLAAKLMRADAELFAERFTCYLIDPHGSGGSTPPQDETAYDFAGHARFYEEVRRALGLGSVSVHGLSFGGSVALTYAALFPEVTTRCVAVSAFAVGKSSTKRKAGRLPRRWKPRWQDTRKRHDIPKLARSGMIGQRVRSPQPTPERLGTCLPGSFRSTPPIPTVPMCAKP